MRDKQPKEKQVRKDQVQQTTETRTLTEPERLDVANTLLASRTGIVLTGRVVNGRVELDKASLEAVANNFADAEISFVAVNAPFDPQTLALQPA